MDLEEALAQADVYAEETEVCTIDAATRTISVPAQLRLFGVENDKRVERIYFHCPKIVGDNQDLSKDYQLFMNYQNANGDPDAYHIQDMEVDGDNITFSWLLEENVTKYRGNIQFAFGAIIPGDEAEDPDKNRWNTTINTDCTCLVGLECTQQVAESNPDALAQIWTAIDELKAGGGTAGKDGREIELQNSGTAIQWRYVGDNAWTDLVQLSELKGDPGDDGITPNIQIGTVQTLEPEQQATASMSGTPENPLLNLGIPKGEKGNPGEDAESGDSYTLPIMSDTQLGGGKAVAKTDEDVPVAVDPLTGQLFVPTYPESGSGASGVTTDHANTLWAIIQKAAFAEQLTDEELTAFKTAWGIEAVVVPATGIRLNKTILSFTDSSSQTLIATVEPSNSTDSVTWETSDAGIATVSSGVVSPVSNGSCTITAKAGSYSASCKVTVNVSGEIVTLQSISVTYAGGEVTVGTALTDLTGITVTAHYSDGSTGTITGYTLSGEIVEGKNTITVSYGGKTTTFTVTGVASGGTESNVAYLPIKNAGSEYWAYFPEVVAGDVYYIAYNISQYAVLRDFSPWALVSASETTWTYEKYNDNYYKITFVTDYGDIGLITDTSWVDLEYSTVKYSKNAVPVE